MFIDNAAPITFMELAHRFTKQGMTADAYRRRFKLPLSFADIVNPKFASEIVGYCSLIIGTITVAALHSGCMRKSPHRRIKVLR